MKLLHVASFRHLPQLCVTVLSLSLPQDWQLLELRTFAQLLAHLDLCELFIEVTKECAQNCKCMESKIIVTKDIIILD